MQYVSTPMFDEPPFGHWLKARRKALDLTQDELARQVGCAAESIRKIEAGAQRSSKQLAERLAQSLGVPADERAAFVRLARAVPVARPPAQRRAPSVSRGKSASPEVATSLFSRPNLPAQPTSLIGREREMRAVGEILRHENIRLLTLIGPGGVGKTRLALAAAAVEQAHFAESICFVPLDTVTVPEQVLPSIAATLRVQTPRDGALLGVLQEELAGRHMLLVLDNCEHLLDAASDVAALLAACPELRILATSRAPLRIRAEHCVTVEPLALPNLNMFPPLDALAVIPAVALFVERARAVLPLFALTAENRGLVAAICVRLEGLPLALELAALRVREVPLAHLLASLDRRLDLLVDGPRDLPTRQQTLRATVAWSYALLTHDEQVLVRRLAVFAGGCTVQAAAYVCCPGELEADVQLRLLRLTEWGILRVEDTGSKLRFTMLDTVRVFADEQLEAAKERQQFRERHARYIADLVEGGSRVFFSQDIAHVEPLLIFEAANIRTALSWAHEHNVGAIVLSIAASPFWHMSGSLAEGRTWLDRALQYQSALSPDVQLRVLVMAAGMAWVQGRLMEAAELHKACLELTKFVTDEGLLAFTWGSASVADALLGRVSTARSLGRVGLWRYRAAGDLWGEGLVLSALGMMQFIRGHYLQAMPLFARAQQHVLAIGGVMARIWTQGCLAEAVMVRGDLRWARELLESSLELSQTIGSRTRLGPTYVSLGRLALLERDFAQAEAYLRKGLTLSRLTEDELSQSQACAGIARVLAHAGRYEHATILLSAAEHSRARIGAALDPHERTVRSSCRDELSRTLGDSAFNRAWKHGQSLRLSEAPLGSSLFEQPSAHRGEASAFVM